MHIKEDTLDDLLHSVFENLLPKPFDIEATRGTSSEIFGIILELTNPRARLSRTETKGKAFSALGELFWYLSKENKLDFISHYVSEYAKESEDNETIYGGYGPRLFNMHEEHDQVATIIDLLKRKPNTRRAVIQIYDAADNAVKHSEIPCTCTLQFVIRDKKLHMNTHMRSNDVFKGLPHDIFTFTMLQEIIARDLDIELGTYKHSVGSLHMYSDKKDKAQQYLKEGYQSTKLTMPDMPIGNPWPSIEIIKTFEAKIRKNEEIDVESANLDSYWNDLIYLLKIYALFKVNDFDNIKVIQSKLSTDVYNTYINQRLEKHQA